MSIEKELNEMHARRLFVTHHCYLQMSFGFLVSQILLVIFALSPNSALGGGSDSKLAVGPHDAQLADVRLHYVVAGHGPLVLVTSPGWGCGSLYLQRGLTPLEEQFTLLYIDTRGSGGSTRPEDAKKMGTAVMADDIDRPRSYLELDSIDLIGHSHGGAIALDYAERYPQWVKRVILIDPEVLDDRPESTIWKFLALWQDDPRYQPAVEAARAHRHSGDRSDEQLAAAFEALFPLYFSDPDRYLATCEKAFEGTHFSAYAQTEQEADDKLYPRNQSREYGNIRAKTLIVSGTVDWICPVEVSERMHAAVAGSRLSLYANVGHFPWIEQPKRFFSELSQFLTDESLSR